jgi:hypothetical protein
MMAAGESPARSLNRRTAVAAASAACGPWPSPSTTMAVRSLPRGRPGEGRTCQSSPQTSSPGFGTHTAPQPPSSAVDARVLLASEDSSASVALGGGLPAPSRVRMAVPAPGRE